ncbi:uncharacterized protein [Procambarus clarkii]|uniref:uncharacterized protein isoform X2 n=1 Tax=Procambarus clarkii TaxID=6728 RepID=UPI0037438467
MIHLVVVLSAAVFAPSDATHAVHFTTHSSPILSAIALPFTQSSMPSVKPTAASATQTTTAFTPTTFLIAIIRSPDITCLRSKDLISLLWSLQQTNKNNIALPYTNLLEQVWSAHLWKCIHLNLMKQSLSKQTKYNKELMQVHLKQIKHLSWLQRISEQNEAQMSEETKWQMSLTKTPKYNSKLIQWIRMSTEYTHTPQGLKVNGKNDEKIKYLANYHRMSQIQEPSVNNSFVPQTQRNENQSLTLIQRQGKQSSIKFNQQISQAQTPIKNKHGVQKYMYSQKNKQKSQRPLDKDKNMPQTSTYMTKQPPKTKIHIGFSAYMNRLRSPVDKRTPVLQMPVQKNKRQQVLKRDSSQLLYDDSQQMKTQYSPPSHSSMGQEASSLFSKTLIKTQPQVSGLKDSLQLPLFHMALNNCYGRACKNAESKWQYIHHARINVKQQQPIINMDHRHAANSNTVNHVSRASIAFGDTKHILKKKFNVHQSNNVAFDIDHNMHNTSNSDPISNCYVLSVFNSSIYIPINDVEKANVRSTRLLDGICAKSFNKACIFRLRICIGSMKDYALTSTTAAKVSDRTIERDSRTSSSSSIGLRHIRSSYPSSTFGISNSSNVFNSNKAATSRNTEKISSSTLVQSKSSTNIFDIDRKQKNKRRIGKCGRVRRGHGYRRLDHRRKNQGQEQRQEQLDRDLSLWIDRKQVKIFSGYMMEIYAIHNGRVLPYILDPNFEKQLPVIPFEVENVNFTWRAGSKRYYYTFDRLYSQDEEVLEVPVLSLPTHGTVPRKSKVFSVKIKCTGNASGIATFGIGLLIQTRLGKPLPGTPLRLKLRKDCTQLGPDPECDQKCENGGVCDEGQRCLCREGYMGQYCNTALCYPQCMNGGTCTMPGRCSCPPGFQGRHCEGGICQNKCQNGGKCVQKDTCDCRRGYYGNRCEFSKCVIPCVNGGRCRDVNKCRCPLGFTGDHCEVVLSQDVKATSISRCSRRCRHGTCKKSTCYCHEGYTGRWCRRRGGRIRGRQGKKVWV